MHAGGKGVHADSKTHIADSFTPPAHQLWALSQHSRFPIHLYIPLRVETRKKMLSQAPAGCFRLKPDWRSLMRCGGDEERMKRRRGGGFTDADPIGLCFWKRTSSSIWASLNWETWVSSQLCNSVKPAQTSEQENHQKHLYMRWLSTATSRRSPIRGSPLSVFGDGSKIKCPG